MSAAPPRITVEGPADIEMAPRDAAAAPSPAAAAAGPSPTPMPAFHTPLPAALYNRDKFSIDPTALPTQTPQDIELTTVWGIFPKFATPSVEAEYRRFLHHAGLWPAVTTYAIGFASFLTVSIITNTTGASLYANYSITVVLFAMGLAQILILTCYKCNSFQDEHARATMWQAIEIFGRTATASLGAIVIHAADRPGGCLRPLPSGTPPPDLCADSYSWALFFWLMLMFTNIASPLHSMLAGALIATPTVVLSMVFAPESVFPAYLTAMRACCYFMTVTALTWWAIASDTSRRATFQAMCEVSFVDNAFEIHRARIVNVVRAALPDRLAVRLARCATVPFPLDAVYDASDHACVIVTSAVDFGAWSSHKLQTNVMAALHHLFTIFDEGQKIFGVDHGTTYGDCYVSTAGLIRGRRSNAANAVRFARWQLLLRENAVLSLHSAITTGPVMGGIAGAKGLRYILAGRALNDALSLLQYVPANTLWVTDETKSAAVLGEETTVQFAPVPFRDGIWAVAPIAGGDGTASMAGTAPSVTMNELGTDLEFARTAHGLLAETDPLPQADGGEKWERHYFPRLNDLCGPTKSTPEDERLYRAQAIAELRQQLPRLGVAGAVMYSLMIVALQVSISKDNLQFTTPYLGATIILGFCFMVSLCAPIGSLIIPKWFSTFRPVTFGVTCAMVGLVSLLGATALLLARGTFISNDPSYYGMLQVMPMVYTICRPMTMLQGMLFVLVVCVIPCGLLILYNIGTDAYTPYVQLVFNTVVALTECRHGPYAFRLNFALTYQLALKKIAVRKTVEMLVSLVSDMVPPHVMNQGVAALDRQKIATFLSGTQDQSAVSQLQATQSVFHEIEVLEDMSDFVMVHVKISSARAVRNVNVTAFKPRASPGVGGLLDAAAKVAEDISTNRSAKDMMSKHATVSLRGGGGSSSSNKTSTRFSSVPAVEVTPLEVLTLWHRISLLTAQVSAGNLHHIQTLGDEFTLGGPFGPSNDASIYNAAAAAVMFLRALFSQLGVVYSAVISLDEASGALVGRGALRYRVFGEASRQGATLLRACPEVPDLPVAFATRNVVKCIAPSLIRFPINRFEAVSWQMTDLRMFFLPRQTWRVKSAGLLHIFPLAFPELFPQQYLQQPNPTHDEGQLPQSRASVDPQQQYGHEDDEEWSQEEMDFARQDEEEEEEEDDAQAEELVVEDDHDRREDED